MENLVTIDKIRDWLIEQVQKKNPIGPDIWLDAAQKMLVLLQAEQELLFELEQKVANTRMEYLKDGDSVAKAKVKVESTDAYREARKQKAKIENCIELIRVAKLQSRMASDVMRGMA